MINKDLLKFTKTKFLEDIKHYDEKLSKNPNDIDSLNDKGIALCALGQLEQGIEYYNKVLKLSPNDHEAIYNKATALTELKRYSEALRCFDICITINSKSVNAYKGKGNVLAQMKEFKRAIACFDIALSLDPNCYQAANNKSMAIFEMGCFEDSIKNMDKLPLNHELSQLMLLNKGKIFYENKRFKEALECFEKCTSLKHGTLEYKDALSRKAQVLFATKRYNEAIDITDQLIKIERIPNHLFNKAAALMAFDKFEQALELLNEAIILDPNHARANGYAGFCCLKLKRWKQALDFYDRALQLADRNDPELENFLMEVIRNKKLAANCYNHQLNLEAKSDDFYQLLLRFEA